MATPEENDILKRLSRRRRRLVNEKGRVCVFRKVLDSEIPPLSWTNTRGH